MGALIRILGRVLESAAWRNPVSYNICLQLRTMESRGSRDSSAKNGASQRVVWSLFLAASLFIGWHAASARGSERAYRTKQAARLVGEALRVELAGDNAKRDELLRQARLQMPNFPPAMWHQGFVRIGKRWVHADQFGMQPRKNKQLEAYDRLRSIAWDSAQDQWSLANWCQSQGLGHQERAHLSRALDLSPGNATILKRLGHRRLHGEWISPSDWEESLRERNSTQTDLANWTPRMAEILKGLADRKLRKRVISEETLKAIRDPSAIPALARMARQRGAVANLAVQTLGEIGDHRAAAALARIAVSSDSTEVRQSAAVQLRERNRDHYVPLMLAAMQSPVRTRTLTYTANGERRYLTSYERENQFGIDQFGVRLDEFEMETEAKRLAHNRQSEALNARIAKALNIATEQQLASDPGVWWKWWNTTNEIYFDGGKPVRIAGAVEEIRKSEFDRQQIEMRQRQQSLFICDCLAPGTTVLSSSGRVAIEKIRPGDLVLSQNVETGEVALKPVLRTTIRPQSVLVKITIANEVIEASGGHPFWVAGQGWVKARELKPKMELHGVNSTRRVISIDKGEKSKSYNLIVADFNSYFVGEQKILSHDNTIRRPTNSIVPGLIAE